MEKWLTTAFVILLAMSVLGLFGCSCKQEETPLKQTAIVERSDLIISVFADGNLDMPREVQLKFGAPGTVEKVYVKKGQKVKEGTLLAKLDDTMQKLNIASAQYDVELAMNELVGRIYRPLLGYPKYYPDASSYFWVEQAYEELGQARELIMQSNYKESAAMLQLARHDLEASYDMLNLPEITEASIQYGEYGNTIETFPDIPRAIKLLKKDLGKLADIQSLMEDGEYEKALANLEAERYELAETYKLVKNISGTIIVTQRASPCCGGDINPDTGSATGAIGALLLAYPDTSTALDLIRQVEEELVQIQHLIEQDNYDKVELTKILRMAQNDVKMSQIILKDNELIFRNGPPLKDLRTYNLNLQKANQALKAAKEELLKTEILAPFDGVVVDIGVKENDQLSSFDYSSKTAVHLVDTKTVELNGTIDEVDIFKVKVGQEASITLDAIPDTELKGRVIFISPFGTEVAGVTDFLLTIALEPCDLELKGGLTATADIIVEKYPDVLLVPSRSVKGSPGDYWVDVVVDEAEQTTEKRPVILGAQSDDFYEALSGLEEGEKVIVEPTRVKTLTLF